MTLDPPIYPQRSVHTVGECGMQPLRDLERWVKGGKFHRYGTVSWEPQEDETWADAFDRCKMNPAELRIDGKLLDYRHHVEYWIWYRRCGDPDAHGGGGGYGSPEDAAYACLTYIEQDERELYEEIVVGLA